MNLRLVWISQHTGIISPYSINRLVSVTETEVVYCAERAKSLNIIILVFRGLSWEFHYTKHTDFNTQENEYRIVYISL